MKKSIEKDGYVIRLMNNSETHTNTKIYIGDDCIDLSFGKYEVKMVVYDNGFKECYELLI